jgi:hypothetical protein
MGRPRKYFLNEDYFENIDTQSKAYILGFIYADGSVSEEHKLTITISVKDKDILNYIKNELCYTGYLKFKPNSSNKYICLSIYSKKITDDLIKLGIIPNKTYFSKKIPNYGNFFKEFLLGFFDGDGSIFKSKYKNRKDEYVVNFSCNLQVLTEIKNKLLDYNISSNNIRRRYKNNDIACMLDVKGSLNIEKFFNLFYVNNNSFHLHRKYDRFLDFIELTKTFEKRKFNLDCINMIKDMYISGLKQYEIAKQLNKKFSSVRCVVQRLRKEGLVI